MSLFEQALQPLASALDVSSIQNKTISNNIANVDTPGFKSQNVRFEDSLNSALKRNETTSNPGSIQAHRTHENHLPFSTQSTYQHVEPVVTQNNATVANHNGNNVDLDYEMNQLAQNQIHYQGLVDRLNGQVNKLHTVISEGR